MSRAESKWLFLKGLLILISIPLTIVLCLALFLSILPAHRISLLPPIDVESLMLFVALVYVFWLIGNVSYSDWNILSNVNMLGVPKEIQKRLKVTTRNTNRLVNVEIINILAKRPVDQSVVIKQVRARGISLSDTQIIKYLHALEGKHIHIVKSEKEYTREYSLTEVGKWCSKADKIFFPRTQFWYILRYYLGFRETQPFPNSEWAVLDSEQRTQNRT